MRKTDQKFKITFSMSVMPLHMHCKVIFYILNLPGIRSATLIVTPKPFLDL